jgi:hypothetical protein
MESNRGPATRVLAGAFVIILLAAVQMLFLLIQQKQGLDVKAAFEREFPIPPGQDALLVELTALSREGEILCFQYSEAPHAIRPWTEKRCESSPWWLHSASVDAEILGAGGKIWDVRLRTANRTRFYVALWLMRALAVLSVLGIAFPRFMKKETIVQRKTGP